MRYVLGCGEIVEGCTLRLEAPTRDQLVAEWVAHVRDDHGIDRPQPELVDKLSDAIRTSDD